jgi:tripartite-type tricarboxylate transporter receptor subunit TctC
VLRKAATQKTTKGAIMLKAFRSFSFASSVGLLVFLFPFFIAVSPAVEYPTKTIQIINPFPAGASTDILARILTDKLSALLGQPVVVINKTGGGGAIGIKA